MVVYPEWQGLKSMLSVDDAEVFFDGTFSDPQLNHPEGLAFDHEGHLWCGGERGEIFRIAHDGSRIEQMTSTDGFTLGLAFDRKGRLYHCDLKHRAVFRLEPGAAESKRFAIGDREDRMLQIPNYPLVDERNGVLYVSDSHHPKQPGPGIWKFDLETGAGALWYDQPLVFANGMALAADGSGIYVAETFARRVSWIPIHSDGSAGERRTVVELDALPDGLALDQDGKIFISCYEPSMIYQYDSSAGLQLLFYDPEAHTLCHPTNMALYRGDVYAANLGRWHITRLRGCSTRSEQK